jgi:hypothetical protein
VIGSLLTGVSQVSGVVGPADPLMAESVPLELTAGPGGAGDERVWQRERAVDEVAGGDPARIGDRQHRITGGRDDGRRGHGVVVLIHARREGAERGRRPERERQRRGDGAAGAPLTGVVSANGGQAIGIKAARLDHLGEGPHVGDQLKPPLTDSPIAPAAQPSLR